MFKLTRAVLWPLVFFLLLALPIVSAVFVKAQDRQDIQRLIEVEPVLYRFIAQHTSYDTSMLPPVFYRFADQKTLNTIYYGRDVEDSFTVQALYNSSVVLLRDDFSYRRDAYILLHELVHHVQFHNGAQFNCVREMEYEAYDVMDKWVELTGNGERTDPMFKLLLTCKEDYLSR